MRRDKIDTLRSMVISPKWTNQEEHIGILSLSKDLVRGFVRLGHRPVIVVDTFSGDKLGRYLTDICCLGGGLVVRAFALITDEDELKRRLEGRPPEGFKDFEISKKLNYETVKHLCPTEELIDTTRSTPEEAAQKMLDILDGC